jgi:hypothetical protein
VELERGEEVWSEILKMAPSGRGGIRKPGGRGSGGGQQGSEVNRQQPKAIASASQGRSQRAGHIYW